MRYPIKLDIGSGGPAASYLGEGWTGVDDYHPNADVMAPMTSLYPYNDNSVDEIYTSHALEHIGKAQVPLALAEFFRVLKPSGALRILVPDLEWCVKHWLQHKEDRGWALDIIFGNQNHEGEYHKTGFTQATLTNLVLRAGFDVSSVDLIQTHGQQTIALVAFKPGAMQMELAL
jgi:predicted SAM-dependent methyltransferase